MLVYEGWSRSIVTMALIHHNIIINIISSQTASKYPFTTIDSWCKKAAVTKHNRPHNTKIVNTFGIITRVKLGNTRVYLRFIQVTIPNVPNADDVTGIEHIPLDLWMLNYTAIFFVAALAGNKIVCQIVALDIWDPRHPYSLDLQTSRVWSTKNRPRYSIFITCTGLPSW